MSTDAFFLFYVKSVVRNDSMAQDGTRKKIHPSYVLEIVQLRPLPIRRTRYVVCVLNSTLLHADKTSLVDFTRCIGAWVKGANNIKTTHMVEGDLTTTR